MKFAKQFLQDLDDGDEDVIHTEIYDHSRWSVRYRRVFTAEGKFYQTYYSIGATEYQDESAYDYEPDEIECEEVMPTEVTVIQYLPVATPAAGEAARAAGGK